MTRVRNIGEHAVVSDNNDRLRNTRTIITNWWERAFIAPYSVNYHLEHHPDRQLPLLQFAKSASNAYWERNQGPNGSRLWLSKYVSKSHRWLME